MSPGGIHSAVIKLPLIFRCGNLWESHDSIGVTIQFRINSPFKSQVLVNKQRKGHYSQVFHSSALCATTLTLAVLCCVVANLMSPAVQNKSQQILHQIVFFP